MSLRKKKRNYGGSYEKQTPPEQTKLNERLDAILGGRVGYLPSHEWEYGLTIGVTAQAAAEVFNELRHNKDLNFNMLVDVTAVDWLDKREPRFDVVYQLLSLEFNHRLCVKISVGEDKPAVPTVRPHWHAANFLEREVWDMYGIDFEGHGDLRRILMYDEFVGHPLRKDYPIRGKQPRIPLRIPELRNTSQDMFKEQLVSLPTRQKSSRDVASK